MFDYNSVNLAWSTTDTHLFVPIITSLIGFAVFWFISKSERIKAKYYAKYSFDIASVKHIYFTKIVGFVTMGVLPVLGCFLFTDFNTFESLGLILSVPTLPYSLAWIVGLAILVMPITYFSAQKAKNLVNYPQIRAKIWTQKTVILNVVGWSLYLLGYEVLFRGVLLFPLVEYMGVWPAIAVNIALYSATHIPKGMDETIGAAPLGLVLCLLTLASGSLLIAFVIHVVLALTNSFTALKFHPEINYQKE